MIIPNPVADGSLSVYMKVDRTQQVSIRLLDMTGRLLKEQTRQVSAGESQYNVGVSSLQRGTYLVQIIGEDFKAAKKVLID